MSRFVMKLPDVGEGVAEAELVEWKVAVGDRVTPDSVIAEVLTDKATVEVSAPVAGEVMVLHGEPGDVLAVGGELIGIETDQESAGEPAATEPEGSQTEVASSTDNSPDSQVQNELSDPPASPTPGPEQTKSSGSAHPLAAPAVRARAAELGVALETVLGSGPDGRILHADIDRALDSGVKRNAPTAAISTRPTQLSSQGHATPVRGVRRKIAERMTLAWQEIPHITYVDSVDVTELEKLRSELNSSADRGAGRLTILPFLARALVLAVADQPGLNALYDHASETLTTFDAVHIGIATQTDDGLRVPVVRHAEGKTVHELAAEMVRVTTAAREGSATRDELSGSTITITSLGSMGGLVTTPIINSPEVAILGVNKIETRPVWADGAFRPRQVMNLSSSFDHRMVDGWDAAIFIQRIKKLVETPALLFI